MVESVFFPQRPESHPMIYAYEDFNPQYKGLLKVGYTEKDVESRVAQQYPTKRPDGKLPYRIVFRDSAMKVDGSCFTDHEVHAMLVKLGYERVGGEWFRCTPDAVRMAMLSIKNNFQQLTTRTQDFKMRPEQRQAVEKTIEYYHSAKKDSPNRAPKFLWNAKMRFGKTFASYELAKKMGFKKILVLTFKPAVEAAWDEDLNTHVDFEGWQFVSNKDAHGNGINIDAQYAQCDQNRPIVCFGSFQDLLGTNESGGIKAKNEFIHSTNWDIVIFDEYHFGAWRENAKKLFESEDEDESFDFDPEKYKQDEADNAYNETFLPITTGYYLFSPARRSAPSTAASSSRTRFITGPTPTSSEQKRRGATRRTTPTVRCRVWS